MRPGPAWGPIAEATYFAGSNSGTTPSCIFAVGRDAVTLTFWADRAVAARLGALAAAAEALGVAAEVWE